MNFTSLERLYAERRALQKHIAASRTGAELELRPARHKG